MKQIKRKILFAGVAGVLLFGGSRLIFAQTGKQNPQASGSLRSLDGTNFMLESLRGKPAVLVFGASWLPLSRDQIKIANQLQQTYSKRGVAIYFVYTDASEAKAKNYASDEQLNGFGTRNKLGVPTIRDPQATMLKSAFDVDQIPAFVILDKEGKAAAKLTGIDPDNDLTKQISAEIDRVL
ncbi:MAG TPA: TlpA disulfide reductase family protein [Pyrinomonadaceae bacterium]|jgi:thiol-disulfide isomerase/thioredoxin|nr:TlpA disulfide reductase family protein [Pyrinomonadaceae bacterium]